MALTTRMRQESNLVCIDIWVGEEGLAELDFDATIANFTTNTWNGSSIVLPTGGDYTPVFPLIATVQSGEGSSQAIIEMRLDVLAGKVFPTKQWVCIFKASVTTPVAGEADGTVTLGNLTKAEDASGVAISGSNLLASAFTVTHLTTLEATGVTALQGLAGKGVGLSADSATTLGNSSDSLARNHFSDYTPGSPTSPLGGGDAPIINANICDEDFHAVLIAGLISRGTGPNTSRFQLTDAGKRALGYTV